jgi:hypothetical protein
VRNRKVERKTDERKETTCKLLVADYTALEFRKTKFDCERAAVWFI